MIYDIKNEKVVFENEMMNDMLKDEGEINQEKADIQ